MKRKSPVRKSSGASKSEAAPLGGTLGKVLKLIKAQPGIRPSEINRRLDLSQSDALRATLIRRGLVRKEKEGAVARYYAL